MALVGRARRGWTELAGVPVEFPAAGVSVVVSLGSRLCPPGWAGIVAIGGSAIVTVPDEGQRELVAGAGLPVAALTEADQVRAVLPVAQALGPAALAYVDESHFRPTGADTVAVPVDHPAVVALLAATAEEEAAESTIDEITSAAFVVRDAGGAVLAVAGYRLWLDSVAHLSVLSSAEHRGRGLARAVASAAVADALASGLLPQWRTRVPASRRVATALGFAELGAQLSVRLDP